MYTLYIGNKHISTWSLRAWVLMKTAGIPFREQLLPLEEAGSSARLKARSPSAKVPCLHDGAVVIWDSMAIAEYLAESHPGLWPADAVARAWARSAAAEMHSGFSSLRSEFEMDLRLWETRIPSPGVARDIERIAEIWRDGRQRFGSGGDFLCGSFCIVDAFYCPVALRFRCYGVVLDEPCTEYVRRLLALPAMQEWVDDAMRDAASSARSDALLSHTTKAATGMQRE